VRAILQFTSVTGHGFKLEVKGLRNIDPRIRDKGPWISPFGAAGRVKRVDDIDVVFRRPGSNYISRDILVNGSISVVSWMVSSA
jgi:hypothetical protein